MKFSSLKSFSFNKLTPMVFTASTTMSHDELSRRSLWIFLAKCKLSNFALFSVTRKLALNRQKRSTKSFNGALNNIRKLFIFPYGLSKHWTLSLSASLSFSSRQSFHKQSFLLTWVPCRPKEEFNHIAGLTWAHKKLIQFYRFHKNSVQTRHAA